MMRWYHLRTPVRAGLALGALLIGALFLFESFGGAVPLTSGAGGTAPHTVPGSGGPGFSASNSTGLHVDGLSSCPASYSTQIADRTILSGSDSWGDTVSGEVQVCQSGGGNALLWLFFVTVAVGSGSLEELCNRVQPGGCYGDVAEISNPNNDSSGNGMTYWTPDVSVGSWNNFNSGSVYYGILSGSCFQTSACGSSYVWTWSQSWAYNWAEITYGNPSSTNVEWSAEPQGKGVGNADFNVAVTTNVIHGSYNSVYLDGGVETDNYPGGGSSTNSAFSSGTEYVYCPSPSGTCTVT